MAADARTWIDRFSEVLGVEPPSAADVDELLELAGTAAHASERIAAPLSCWLAAAAGVAPHDALAMARDLAASLGDDRG